MKNCRFIFCLFVGVVLLAGFSGCKNKPSQVADDETSVQVKEPIAAADSINKIEVLDFYATWCGPCRRMAPVMEQMESKYGDKITFRRIDVDQETQLAQEYNIVSIPTLVILSPAKEVIDVIEGFHDATEMDEIFSKLITII